MKFDHKYIQLMYQMLLMNKTDKYNIELEHQYSTGYIDIFIEGRNRNLGNNIIIEVKYIKESDKDNTSLYNEYYKEGIIELNKYGTDPRINKNLRKYLVIYTGTELKLLEEIK